MQVPGLAALVLMQLPSNVPGKELMKVQCPGPCHHLHRKPCWQLRLLPSCWSSWSCCGHLRSEPINRSQFQPLSLLCAPGWKPLQRLGQRSASRACTLLCLAASACPPDCWAADRGPRLKPLLYSDLQLQGRGLTQLLPHMAFCYSSRHWTISTQQWTQSRSDFNGKVLGKNGKIIFRAWRSSLQLSKEVECDAKVVVRWKNKS